MGAKIEVLSLREKMAITYAYYEGITKGNAIYLLCHDREGKSDNPDTVQKLANTWNNRKLVAEYKEEVKARDQRRTEKAIEERMKAVERNPGAFGQKEIDFTNIDDFFAFANKMANQLSDEKDRQFYLKTIADLMRFKEGSQDKDLEIQRFYVPIQCTQCPLYQKEKEEL